MRPTWLSPSGWSDAASPGGPPGGRRVRYLPAWGAEFRSLTGSAPPKEWEPVDAGLAPSEVGDGLVRGLEASLGRTFP